MDHARCVTLPLRSAKRLPSPAMRNARRETPKMTDSPLPPCGSTVWIVLRASMHPEPQASSTLAHCRNSPRFPTPATHVRSTTASVLPQFPTPRETSERYAHIHFRHTSQWHSPSDTREHSRTPGQARHEHGPPPRHLLKNKKPSLRESKALLAPLAGKAAVRAKMSSSE